MFKKLFKFGKKKEEETKDELKESDVLQQEETEAKEENHLEEVSEKVEESIEGTTEAEENIEEQEVQPVVEEENVAEEIEVKEEAETETEDITIREEIVEETNDVNAESIEEVKLETEKEVEEPQEETVEEPQEVIVEEVVEEKEEVIQEPEKKVSLFDRLKQGLTKAKQGITDRIDDVLKSYTKVDEELLEELEEILITADVGVSTTMNIIESLRDKIKEKGITDPMDVREELKEIVEGILNEENSTLDVEKSPTIILMVGVNGVGKTTTIGKLANRYKKEGKKVLLAAGDTFRAAAIEQLEVWSQRSNVDIIKHQEGADPGAVIFDAIKAAKARNVDLLICDTAGRLHNKANLMNELGKVFKIVDREFPEAKREVLLVVDATTGQNAVVQAKTFKEVADITGIVLTKLDGTAKGGVVLAVKSEVDVPVKLIGVGETVEDLQDFNAKAFSDALFGK
ncbi:MAG: signal recognition particle-docking protein FtsY [Peptostreptococcaceae bacterium]